MAACHWQDCWRGSRPNCARSWRRNSSWSDVEGTKRAKALPRRTLRTHEGSPRMCIAQSFTKNVGASEGAGLTKENVMERTKAILVDTTTRTGCSSCGQARKEAHGFPKDTEAKLRTTALTAM